MESETETVTISLDEVREKLKKNGFTGLYDYACGCDIDDLAPCGMLQEGGEYINDCHPGYAHKDPNPGYVEYGDFVVTNCKEPPEDDEFANYYG